MKKLTKNILNALDDAYSNERADIKDGRNCSSGYSIKKEDTKVMLLEDDEVVITMSSKLYKSLISQIFQTYIEKNDLSKLESPKTY